MQMNNETIISLQNVSFEYNNQLILDQITLDIKKGEFLGIVGPNGSGKTTLLKLIVGLLNPSSGQIQIFGKPLKNFRDQWRVGYVPQRAGLQVFNFPITVEEVVQLGLIGGKRHGDDAVRDALNHVEMHKYRKKLLNELSGGQQQRVFIARALVGKPELLILDEPTVGVDAGAQESFYELLRKLNTQMHLTLIMVSHDIDVVTKEVTSVACLNGKLVCHLPAKEFRKKEILEKVYGKEQRFISHHH